MGRKIILFVLALGFLASAVGISASLYLEAVATKDHEDLFAALFMGGMLGFVGVLLMVMVFRKPKPAEPLDAASAIWAVGMTTLADSSNGDGRD